MSCSCLMLEAPILEFYRDLCIDLQASWEGIRTPSGKDKKLPWFMVTHCPSCDKVGFTYIKVKMGMRFRCQEQWIEDGKRLYCEHVLTPIEGIGLTEGEMWAIFDGWKEKYG